MNNCFINSASPNHLRTINNRRVGDLLLSCCERTWITAYVKCGVRFEMIGLAVRRTSLKWMIPGFNNNWECRTKDCI